MYTGCEHIKLINKIHSWLSFFAIAIATFSFAFTINNTSIVMVVVVVIAMVIFFSQNSTTHSISPFARMYMRAASACVRESMSLPLR